MYKGKEHIWDYVSNRYLKKNGEYPKDVSIKANNFADLCIEMNKQDYRYFGKYDSEYLFLRDNANVHEMHRIFVSET